MQLLDYLVEQAILAAMERGTFDHLPGAGKPLALEDDSKVLSQLAGSHCRKSYQG